ncbi:MAG: family acetyltransferase [Microbacterium sp.]|nr:family acetyltransferase [Microbacterium sp.]
MTVEIRPFTLVDEDAVVALWDEAGLTRPWNDPHADIRRKLTVQPELFLVAVDAEVIVGSVMAGYDGHRGWLYYLAAAASHRGSGVGRALVAEAERLLEALGCPKVQLMVRPDNVGARGFYDALGYEPFETWATGKRLVVDGPGGPAAPTV